MERLEMSPAAGECLLRFVGDRVRVELGFADRRPLPPGWQGRLRTNLGRAAVLREEIIQAHFKSVPFGGASWRDVPMHGGSHNWSVELPLAEVGFFQAKAYALDPKGWQHWPEGPNLGVSVHPGFYRTANAIYCAFVRLFGETKGAATSTDAALDAQLRALDQHGYTVIPASGKLRDLVRSLPHIIDTLGCRIVHLLPVNPTPTTFARFGRYGSPYAALDFMAIDPALVEFDRRTSGLDQFRELAYAVHLRGARLFLDLAINHTGWGSTLFDNHPEWFVRREDGTFVSPGAWGVTWEDLVELAHRHPALWDELAEVFLEWCRRGVDGFRCDAGYKVPLPAWQFIIARVRQEFPETIFLLEGLGGSWEATATLLTAGGMQWAYSELFQEFTGAQIAGYLDHAHRQSQRLGLLVHYSETHDNDRLAKRGRAWSLLRNRLSALASVSGAYGFTCGVEWLATEKINVHGCAGLAWGRPDNVVEELARLNRLVRDHPCFFDGAKLTRVSPTDSPVYALRRESAEGMDQVLVLVNSDIDHEHACVIDPAGLAGDRAGGRLATDKLVDLLGQTPPSVGRGPDGRIVFRLGAGASYCLACTPAPRGLSGEAYRQKRAQAAWAATAIAQAMPLEEMGTYDWRQLAARVEADPRGFLIALTVLDRQLARTDLMAALANAQPDRAFPRVVSWSLIDRRRITLVPPDHWLLIHDDSPFRARLKLADGSHPELAQSIAVRDGHVACFPPRSSETDAELDVERYALADKEVHACVRFLRPVPVPPTPAMFAQEGAVVLLTNGRGGMARLGVDFGAIRSKYDCLLGANLHPRAPVDRHIFAKRARVWVNADGFLAALDRWNLAAFDPGPPAAWHFVANAGDGRTVEIELVADMLRGRNSTVLHFRRPTAAQARGKQLPDRCDVRLTVRVDIEDRNFHWETKRNAAAERHFESHVRTLKDKPGFAFVPARDRQLRVYSTSGVYHPQAEWSENIAHPLEQTRGLPASGDAYSPGWFELPLPKGHEVSVVICADPEDPGASEIESSKRPVPAQARVHAFPTGDSFGLQLLRAVRAFVARRAEGVTVVAGYPWFLDWGRDSLICARGLIAAGMIEEVERLLLTYGRLVDRGTLPNAIFGEDVSNRETSDAPLWFALACEEFAARQGEGIYRTPVAEGGLTMGEVLWDIAVNYLRGTPHGVKVDNASGLVWSPSHFTWMDTDHPAGTPREGYPVEVQALWIRLLKQLQRARDRQGHKQWEELADLARTSFERLFWLEEKGYLSDVLLAKSDQPAARATHDTALRSNCLIPISLGLVRGVRAQRCVEAALRFLVVPGAVRSLAPLPVTPPLPIYGPGGLLLNNPEEPYWGRYEGDEDTRRKPAYHNGTAWTWMLPVFCEALARAWEFSPEAVASAKAYLGSIDRLLAEGCLGQLPEILDGDAPHQQRGCDAQAWSATETLRVWRLLNEPAPTRER
jgi:predicted glycogen debranching enzyme